MTTQQLLIAAISALVSVIVFLAGVVRYLYKDGKKKDELMLQLARNGISGDKFKMIAGLIGQFQERKNGPLDTGKLDEIVNILKGLTPKNA